ncbi:YkgJ family cysteine cluster protein [Paludibacteraceae bacterium OttesenSCG-928-F17]|nr:YkgJ family cysteine cluster protein [Paludibacteraceae bacterium OttesenSCG-928-F17]
MQKDIHYSDLPELAAKSESEWKKYLKKNKKKLEKMDVQIHQFHEKYSEKTDCLNCANCCRSLGPRLTDKDIEHMAKATGMKVGLFEEKYLKKDEDGDMVFKSMPCPFLDSDNYCLIYDNRPKACREYPHTDRKRFFQIYNLSIKNAYTCPVVYQVLEEIRNVK